MARSLACLLSGSLFLIATGQLLAQNSGTAPAAGNDRTQKSQPPAVGAESNSAASGAKTTPAPAPKALPEIPPEKLEVVRERYRDGSIRIERHVFQTEKGDYVKHGPWTMWYPDGHKAGGGDFAHGNRQGKWTRWFAPGEGALFQSPLYREYRAPFVSEAHFDSGKLEGMWVVYDAGKQKIGEWAFRGGRQHGVWTWWYPSGQKRREAHYEDGVLHGIVSEWEPDGKLALKETYVTGRKKYLKSWWFAPGQKKTEGWYRVGKPIVKTSFDWWAGDATTVVVGKAEPDVRHGQWTWWHPNGQKWVEGVYQDGHRLGKWTWWAPDGKVTSTKPFTPDDLPRQRPPLSSAGANTPFVGR